MGRNEKAFAAHRKQKKHLENVQKLKESMLEEELINSDDLKDSDQEEEHGLENSDQNINTNGGDIHSENFLDDREKVDVKEVTKQTTKSSKKKGKKSKKSHTSELQCAVCQDEF